MGYKFFCGRYFYFSKLSLPLPHRIPDGLRMLIQQCWSQKARNRPSFQGILQHLYILANELALWGEEVRFIQNIDSEKLLFFRNGLVDIACGGKKPKLSNIQKLFKGILEILENMKV